MDKKTAHILDYSQSITVHQYCGQCGHRVKRDEWQCPTCGAWVDCHDLVISDADEAERLRARWEKKARIVKM